MKKIKILSLFFLFLLCVESGNLFAQQITDSISYSRSLILSPKKEGDLVKGYLYFDKARELSLKQNDTTGLIYSSSMLSIAEFSLGAYHESKNSAITALKLIDESKIDEWTSGVIISLYNSLGKAHKELNDYEKAIESYDNVLRLSENISDSITAYNNKANVYKDEGKFNQALSELSAAYQVVFRNSKVTQNARILHNLGYVQYKLGKPEGIKNMFKALDIRISENDLEGTFSSYTSLIAFYSEKSDKNSAIIYANKALHLSEKINSPVFRKKALSNLLKLEENPWYLEYIEIENELKESKLEQDVKNSHAKYDIDKERQNSLKQKLEGDAKNKRQRLIFTGVGIILLIIALFLYSFLRSKFKKEKIKEIIRETFQTERRLSKKVHDELANDMSDTLNYVDNHEEIPTNIKTHLVNKLDDIYDRTRDISAEIGGFESKDFAKNLKFLITQHRTEGVKVITNVMTGINWDIVSDHKKINIYRSLQELLVNMKKHSKATEVTVIFKSEENKNFINYMDNGIGVSIEDVHIRGLHNVETRMKNILGNVTFNTSKGNGFKARLYFLS